MQVPFGEWLPDLPDHMNHGATQAKNVYPAVNSYRPWKSITTATANASDSGNGGSSVVGAYQINTGLDNFVETAEAAPQENQLILLLNCIMVRKLIQNYS